MSSIKKKQQVFKDFYKPICRLNKINSKSDLQEFRDLMKHFKPFIEQYDNYYDEIVRKGDRNFVQPFLDILGTEKEEMDAAKSGITDLEKEDKGGDFDPDEYMEPENEKDRAFLADDDSVDYDNEAAEKKARKRLHKKSHADVFREMTASDEMEDEKAIVTLLAPATGLVNKSKLKQASLIDLDGPDNRTSDLMEEAEAKEVDLTGLSSESEAEAGDAVAEEPMDADATENEEEEEEEQDEEGGAEGEKKRTGGKKRHAEKPEPRMYVKDEEFIFKKVKYRITYAVRIWAPEDNEQKVNWPKVRKEHISTLLNVDLEDPTYANCVWQEEVGPVFINLANAKKIESYYKERAQNIERAKKLKNLIKDANGTRTIICWNHYKDLAKKRSKSSSNSKPTATEAPVAKKAKTTTSGSRPLDDMLETKKEEGTPAERLYALMSGIELPDQFGEKFAEALVNRDQIHWVPILLARMEEFKICQDAAAADPDTSMMREWSKMQKKKNPEVYSEFIWIVSLLNNKSYSAILNKL